MTFARTPAQSSAAARTLTAANGGRRDVQHAQFDKWDKAGYRLVNVDSYLEGGDVRYEGIWYK